jgi:single-strand DNA-binding protein
MSNIRKAYLEGNLTRDPETRPVGEWSVLAIAIACNESKKQPDGTFKDQVHYFDLEYWTKKPQYWLQKLTKGKGIWAECEPCQERWEKDGQQRSKIKFKIIGMPGIRSSAQSAMDGGAKPAPEADQWADDAPF